MENQVKTQDQIEQEMLELNKQFGEFLHTKGLKAKFNLVVENIKKGAQAAPQKTAESIAKAKAKAHAPVNPHAGGHATHGHYTAESLAEEFNEFLKMKGLDTQYTVEIKSSDES